MSFPYSIFQDNFETGDASGWDSETDNDSILDFPHYTTLSAEGLTPYSGAYCMRLKPAGGSNDATLTEGDMNIAADGTAYIRFNLLFGHDFTATATDTVTLLELKEGGGTVEVSFGFKITATTDAIQLGIGETTETSLSTSLIERGKWYTVELYLEVDAGGGNDGSIDLYVTEEGKSSATSVFATQVGSLDQNAITDGVLGLQDYSTTTTGTILIDNFVMDDGRVYVNPRWPQRVFLTQSGHVFVGNGRIRSVVMHAANADNRVYLYDSDIAANDVDANTKLRLAQPFAAATEVANFPIQVTHGAYLSLVGTNPSATVSIDYAGAYGNNAVLVNYGQRR